jgi:hypothetical protein
MISYTLSILVKKLLSIETVIVHTFALSEALSEKYNSQEFASNKLEKRPLQDFKTVFCSPVAFMVLVKKIF